MQNQNTLKICTHMSLLNKQKVSQYFKQTSLNYKNCIYCYNSLQSIKAIMCLHCASCICSTIHKQQSQQSYICLQKHLVQYSQHCLYLYSSNHIVYCHKCDDSLENMILAYTGDENQNQYKRADRFINYIKQISTNFIQKYNPSLYSKTFQFHPKFKNLGNTCFLNVILQLLYACKPLVDKYQNIEFQQQKRKNYKILDKNIEFFYDEVIQKWQNETWHVVTSKTQRRQESQKKYAIQNYQKYLKNPKMHTLLKNLFYQLKANNSKQNEKSYPPYEFIDELIKVDSKYGKSQQNDADEVMILILDLLSQGQMKSFKYDSERYEKIQKILGKQKLSITENTFGSYLASRLSCRQCKKVQWRLDLTFQLAVQIQYQNKSNNFLVSQNQSQKLIKEPIDILYYQQLYYPSQNIEINKLIKDFFSEQILTKSHNYYSCEKCSSLTGTKKFYLVSLPPILLITLKRFNGTKKNSAFVEFPSELDLEGVALVQNQQKQQKNISHKQNNKKRYNLIGVINHIGTTLTSGHYVIYLKNNKQNNEWVCCSDDKIRKVTWKQVKSRQAYILIYQRKNLSQ